MSSLLLCYYYYYLTRSTLVAHSICFSFQFGSSQSKS